MSLKRLLIITIVYIVVFGFSQTTWSKVKIATGEYAPFTTETKEDKGFFSAIVTAAFKEMGEDVEFTFFPWKRCERVVEQGEFFAAIPYAKSEERENIFDFSDIAHVTVELLYYHEPHNDLSSFNYTKYSDLKSYRIAGILGYYFVEPMRKIGIDVDKTPNEISAFRKLIMGRVDIVPIDEITGAALIKANFANEAHNIKTVKNPFTISYSHLMISRKYPDAKALTEKFNKGLIIITENNIYDDILKRYNLD